MVVHQDGAGKGLAGRMRQYAGETDVPARRIETQTSRTAERTCCLRAVSSLESSRYYRSDDHIALLLVPTFLRIALHLRPCRWLFTRVLAPKGIYEYVVARTKYIDAALSQALTEQCDQVLILGSGFDTRALRFDAEAKATRIFEVDTPITQNAKLGQYRRRRLAIPPNVTFVAVDFDKESWLRKLTEAGFRRGQRDLFILEGLLMYLQSTSVDELFQDIQSCTGLGSRVVFDYVHTPALRGEGSEYGASGITERVTQANEQWHFGLEEGDIEQFLSTYGLRLVDHRDAQALEALYFTDTAGRVVGRMNGTHSLVTAERV